MATELATAYLALVPSLRGLQANLERELKPVPATMSKAGDEAGKSLGQGVSRGAKREAEKGGADAGRSFGQHFKLGATALLGLTGAGLLGLGAAEMGKQIVDAAGAESSAQARLANAIKATGSSYEDHRGQIEKTVADYEKFGYAGDVTQNALSRLVTATKSPTKAIADLGIAANLAAARHIDLDTAATLVGRVATGNTGILARFGISLNVASGNAKALTVAQGGLARAQQHLTQLQDELRAKTGASGAEFEKVRIAQLKLTAVEDSLRGKTHLTAAEQVRLAQAHDAVAAAEANLQSKTHLTVAESDRLKNAQQAVTAAQEKLRTTSGASTTAMGQLGKMFGGAAASQANSFAGRLNALKAQITDTFARIGLQAAPAILALAHAVLIVLPPIARLAAILIGGLLTGIRDVMAAITSWVGALQQGRIWAVAIAVAVAGLAVGIGIAFLPILTTLIATTWASVAAFAAQAIAMAAAYAPFIAIGIAAAVVAAGIYYLVRLIIDHWSDITGFFVHTWNTIWPYLKTWGPVALAVLVPFIGIPLLIWQHWSQITAFLGRVWGTVWPFLRTWGPVALAVLVPFIGIPLLIWQHFSTIAGLLGRAWSAAYNTVKSWVDTIGSYIGRIPGFITGLGGRLAAAGGSIMSALWNGITSTAAGAVDFARRVINDIIAGLNRILPHQITIGVDVGPVHVHQTIPLFPNIPSIATGGMTLGPTLAYIGDNRSGNELVAPMDDPRTITALTRAMTPALASVGAGAGTGTAGPLMYVDKQYIEDSTDAEIVARKMEFLLTTRRL